MGTIIVVEGKENGLATYQLQYTGQSTITTTVGCGDISPQRVGRFIASIMMLMGWGTLAVPTGIDSFELGHLRNGGIPSNTRTCHDCHTEGHLPDARYCMQCGAQLPQHHTNNRFLDQ